MTQTFWLEPTGKIATGLRRYSGGQNGFTCTDGYHSALVYIDTALDSRDEQGFRTDIPEIPHDDPRWPKYCDKECGYSFIEEDRWQLWTESLYRRTDTGELRVLHPNAPAPNAPSAESGACWDAWWIPFSRGADGIYLMVRLPDGHDWAVDSQASNCTRPGEPHQCWVRHGNPRECCVTVDKNGDTCQAGAGSIGTSNWHGFLRNGLLVPA